MCLYQEPQYYLQAVRSTGVEETTKIIYLMEHKRTTSNYLKTTYNTTFFEVLINVPEPRNFVANKLNSEAKNNIDLEQWISTFYARRTPKIISGLHAPLNYQTDWKKMPFVVHNFTFMTSVDPLHGSLGGHLSPVKNQRRSRAGISNSNPLMGCISYHKCSVGHTLKEKWLSGPQFLEEGPQGPHML